MRVRSNSLRDMIEKIDWKVLYSGKGTRSKLPEDGVAICFIKNNKKNPDPHADLLKIRLGREVVAKLDWEAGDKIVALHDPDDLLSILLVKKEGKGGKSLTRESSTHVHCVTFKWDSIIKFMPTNSIKIEYETHRQYLHFRIPDADNEM